MAASEHAAGPQPTAASFPILALPPEILLRLSEFTCTHRLALPTTALTRSLASLFRSPPSIARRGIRHFGSATSALRDESSRAAPDLAVIAIFLSTSIPADELHLLLLEAAVRGHVGLAALLLDHDAPGKGVDLALYIAADRGRVEVARLLLDRGGTSRVRENGETPLSRACRMGHLSVVRLLLERCVADDATLGIALCMAARSGETDIVRLLVDSGADIHAQDDEPLRWAARFGHAEVVRLLLGWGADCETEGGIPGTGRPLTHAARWGHTEVVRILLECGADVDADAGVALRVARQRGQTEVVKLLESWRDRSRQKRVPAI